MLMANGDSMSAPTNNAASTHALDRSTMRIITIVRNALLTVLITDDTIAPSLHSLHLDN